MEWIGGVFSTVFSPIVSLWGFVGMIPTLIYWTFLLLVASVVLKLLSLFVRRK